MSELLDKIIAEIEPEMSPFVEADFFAKYKESYRKEIGRALRLNFLRLAQLNPACLLEDKTLQYDKRALAEHFFRTWPEFASYEGEWEAVPWSDDGYYVPAVLEQNIGKSAAYKLGLFYLQESSAMLPANLLAAQAYEIVGDFCAAPGGKSGKIASDLAGTSILISNDLSNARAHVLLRNLNQLGVWHNTVFNTDIAALAANLGAVFDAVILDVPCSGEGMLRKDKRALASRLASKPAAYHDLQLSLLTQAWSLLQDGGRLVYSTCTFNVQENEAVIYEFLKQTDGCEIAAAPHIDATLPGLRKGFAYKGLTTLEKAYRIFPQDNYGEGHFAVLLRKKARQNIAAAPEKKVNADSFVVPQAASLICVNPKSKVAPAANKRFTKASQQAMLKRMTETTRRAKGENNKDFSAKEPTLDIVYSLLEEFLQTTMMPTTAEYYRLLFKKYPYFKIIGESLEWLIDLPILPKHSLHVLSEGLWLGQIKAHRSGFKFIPAHTWALQLTQDSCRLEVKVSATSGIYEEYVAGASFNATDLAPYLFCDGQAVGLSGIDAKGKHDKARYALLTLEGFSGGWLQFSGRQVKNCYPPGWISL